MHRHTGWQNMQAIWHASIETNRMLKLHAYTGCSRIRHSRGQQRLISRTTHRIILNERRSILLIDRFSERSVQNSWLALHKTRRVRAAAYLTCA